MKHLRFLPMTALLAAVSFFSSCSDDPDPVVVPPNEEGLIEVDGGGATYPNSVFISLRSGVQTPVARTTWDLAFSTGSDFKVLINGTTGAMASATDKTDINAVGATEIAAAEASGELVMGFTNMLGILHVDDAADPLSNPTIAAVSATEANNLVYLLSRGASGVDAKPWKKIRVIRNGEGYTLQHADADATTFTSLNISKDSDDNFVYVNFENGVVNVEPAKTDWDIVWTAGTSETAFPAATNGKLAYFYQDLVYHNIYGGTSAVAVLEETVPFAEFDETDVPSLVFNSDNRLTIGSTWRYTGGPSSPNPPSAFDTIYYVVKDSDGNVYKLRFLSLTKDGERGKPSFEYELVEAGN
ncbi:hypothetical protein J0A67_14485 [Algoriphagus aestuariicola]|uniref:Heme-binding HmuY-like protein n=1 Tax=Algoriphagus aestuariicola TaxID=1852016 RepID=A0ABS3BRZ8_9BACT|nr:HmuY family protein [Algoriphagus aestuariicola]MBN7802078.1 hypothetical protein [Algoriphagus aestuariicola]